VKTVIYYKNGLSYSFEEASELTLKAVLPQEIMLLIFNGLTVRFNAGEVPLKHQLHRYRGEDGVKEVNFYVLSTNMRDLFFFPDGGFRSTPNGKCLLTDAVSLSGNI
jgi:hypothetical protein